MNKNYIAPEEEPFFNFTLFQPIITFGGKPLGEVLEDMWQSDVYPMSVFHNKNNENKNEVFKAINKGNKPADIIVDFVIVPVRYTKEFLA